MQRTCGIYVQNMRYMVQSHDRYKQLLLLLLLLYGLNTRYVSYD